MERNSNLHYCLFKINEKNTSIVDFFFFCCTEIVANRDPQTEVRIEPWHLCTMPPLIYIRAWTISDFLKLTFMWWKSSRSRIVADDIINEQISLELWQTPCAQLWNMSQCCPHDYCTYNSLFLSVLSSLCRYISHRFLLVLNQIQMSSTVKINSYEWMH